MTIKFFGHVQSLEIGTKAGGIKLTLIAAASRCEGPIVIETERGEADIYRPGMAVEFTIVPRMELKP